MGGGAPHRGDSVLILGATSDIARAIGAEFAQAGHPLMLAARNSDALERDMRDLSLRFNVSVSAHPFDACAVHDIQSFFDRLPATPGVVICAVGHLPIQSDAQGDAAVAQDCVAINFLGPALFLEAAAQRLAALDRPTAIVGISSVAGDRGRAKNYWYGAAKAGFTAILSGLRQKHATSGLLVMTVKPGFVATRMIEGLDTIPFLTETPQTLAKRIHRGVRWRNRVIYGRRWWPVMLIIRLLPEWVFERLKF